MLALRRFKSLAATTARPSFVPKAAPKVRRAPATVWKPSPLWKAPIWKTYCTDTETAGEDLSDELETVLNEFQDGTEEGLDGEEEVVRPLGSLHRHIPADHFNWGAIKDQVFGEFGKRSPPMPIRRLSFVPEPTSDEMIVTKIPVPEPMAGYSEFAPTGQAWYIPLVPKPRPVVRDGNTVTGLGRRKRAVANVTMTPGSGKINVNGRHWMYYFKDAPIRNNILEPLTLTEYLNKWDIEAQVSGGGFRGQAGAVRLAISRALLRWDPELQPPLKRAGYLTRDKREVERKKPGKLKARRSFQWVKR